MFAILRAVIFSTILFGGISLSSIGSISLPLTAHANPFLPAPSLSQRNVTPEDLSVQVKGSANISSGAQATFEEDLIPTVIRYLVGLLGIIFVGVALVAAFRLFTADGNEEEFKNAWKALVYAAVGLAMIPLAFAVVRIVVGITL